MSHESSKRTTGRRGFLGALGAVGGIALAGGASGTRSRTVEVNVGYTTQSGLDAALAAGTEVLYRFAFDALTVRIPESAVDALRGRPDVRYVEANDTWEMTMPTGPRPQTESPTRAQVIPYGIDRVDAEVAHENGITGAGVDVAIIDTGIDETHPDLRANLDGGRAFVPGIGDVRELGLSRTTDDFPVGHGTHCAGIADAPDNDIGVVGVSTEATVHAVKAFTALGGITSVADVAASIEYVADQGWDVANMSFGFPRSFAVLEDAVADANDRGVLLVAAAGNEGMMPGDMPSSMGTSAIGYPAAYGEVLAIGATNRADGLAEFSSTGPEVDLVAPGVEVLSTSIRYPNRYLDGSPFPVYSRLSGTSFACPHVAGAGALLVAEGYSNTEARDRLTDTAEDIGLSANEGGDGLLDVAAALDLAGDDLS